MSDSVNPLEEMQAQFTKEGIPLPFVPPVFEPEFRSIAPWTYGTRSSLPSALYDISAFVEEAEESPAEEYLLIGHDGHGVNSYAIHYYLVYGPVALFFQVAWGGAYTDREKSAKLISQLFERLKNILELAEKCRNQGGSTIRTGRRYLLMLSQFYGGRWRLPHEEDWREEGDALQEVEDYLNSLQKS